MYSSALVKGLPKNVSERPLGRYDLAGVKRHPWAFIVWPRRFLRKIFRSFWLPGGIQKKQEKRRTPLACIRQQLWLMFRFGARDSVVGRVGIADGSRAKYVVGI